MAWTPRVKWSPGRWTGAGQQDVEYISHLETDHDALAEEAGRISVEMVKARVKAGIGSDGRPLGTPLVRTGQMVNSITVRSSKTKNGKTTVVVGPSNQQHAGSQGALLKSKAGAGRRKKFSNYALGQVLAYGAAHKNKDGTAKRHVRHDGKAGSRMMRLPARPFMPLTTSELRTLLRRLTGRSWMRQRPGPPR
jgi:phage gpG-like protein